MISDENDWAEEPSQWELYSTVLTWPTLEWRERANYDWRDANPMLWLFKAMYPEPDRVEALSVQEQPMLRWIERRNRP